MKIVRRGALPVGGDSGLLEIRDRAVSNSDSPRDRPRDRFGEEDVFPGYVDKVLSFIDPASVKPLRVVIDAANGMAGAMLPPVLERLPIDPVPYFFELDGSFPNHEPNPLLPENREFVIGKVLEEKADLGAAFDGDADRCFFIDDTGRVRARRLRDGAARRAHAREAPGRRRSSTTSARAGRCGRRSSAPAASR